MASTRSPFERAWSLKVKLHAGAALALAGCGQAVESSPDESTARAQSALEAHCTVNVKGTGTIDVEEDYLPHVVHCENGGAPYEALKAQAIAARTYLYFTLQHSDAIGDGSGHQVYSCGSEPTKLQKKAVQETAGQVLRHSNKTICSFFVAGDKSLDPPECLGDDDDAWTEHYVTYNDGLTGDAVQPSPLGSLDNPNNRGCMSQWGSRCLSNAGKGAKKILEFYYGADVEIVGAKGSCIDGSGGAGGASNQDGDHPDAGPPGELGSGGEGSGGGPCAEGAGECGSTLSPSGDATIEGGCALSGAPRSAGRGAPLATVAVGLALALARRRRSPRPRSA